MSSANRYAYITAVDLSIDNGPGINEREFVKELIAYYGDRVVCFIPYPSKPDNYFDGNIEYVINHRRHNLLYYIFYMISTIFKVIKVHRKTPFDALVFRLDILPIEPIILTKVLKIPFMLKTLAGYTGFSDLAGKRLRLISMISLPLYRMVTHMAIAADTVSTSYIHWQESRFRLNRNLVHIIYNGANMRIFAPFEKDRCRGQLKLDLNKYVIGYVGALSTLRNVDMLVRAFSRVQNLENAILVLVGDGKDRNILETIIKECGLSKHVVFTGAVPYTEVPKYMNAFDVAVDLTNVPMKIGDTVMNASYSQKIPQYLGCGLPVIAWDVDDNKFITTHNIGALAQIEDEDSLVVALENLKGMNVDEKRDMSVRARAYAEQVYSIDHLTQRRISLWDKSIKNIR